MLEEETPDRVENADVRAFSSQPAEGMCTPDEYAHPVMASFADEVRQDVPRQRVVIEPARAILEAELVEEVPFARATSAAPARTIPNRRRVALPLMLFVATCVSTFFAGACAWFPSQYLELAMSAGQGDLMPLRRIMFVHWADGLVYMGCVIAILLTHEMGHFVATLRYRIPASFPYFLPLPISPIGTLGAVIGMDGSRANRREIFDIGIAGPLAGLAVAIPLLWIGVSKLDFTQPEYGIFQLDNPLIVQFLLDYLQPAGYTPGQRILHGHLNPFFMAGWVGLLVTGLNMMPVSQLDGGHVIYTLLGRRGRWFARGFILVAVGFIVYTAIQAIQGGSSVFQTAAPGLSIMVMLIMLVGIDHPPTRDDQVRLGWFRTILGYCSLAIPILCFAPKLMIFLP